MSQQQTTATSSHSFFIQSKIDNQKYAVDQKIINSSSLLKNICDITDISEPIIINCSGDSLNVFINLISHYQTYKTNDEHDIEFEKNLYNTVAPDKEQLIKLIQDLCILDSDFFLDSVADYILGILGEKKSCHEIQKYLGIENDFSEKERNLIKKDEKLEYFLSIDTETFKFPFANKNLYSLKTDFSTPMNALIARMIERSNEKICWSLSLINKTIKNEVDRHPFKITTFEGFYDIWILHIYNKSFGGGFTFYLNCNTFEEKYFNILIKRGIIAMEEFRILFDSKKPEKELFIKYKSFDFNISKSIEVSFQRSYKTIYQFDITKCRSPSIYYKFASFEEKFNEKWKMKFEEIYEQLIAKDLSKNIELQTFDIFKFFSSIFLLKFYKKPNALKFYKIELNDNGKICPAFKSFVKDYMEDDGIINSTNVIRQIPQKIIKMKGYHSYSVSSFLNHL